MSTKLSALLVAAALIGAPVAAFADPATITHTQGGAGEKSVPAPISDTERYAAREAKAPEAATFRGGSETLIIGGTTLGIVLLVLVLVILL